MLSPLLLLLVTPTLALTRAAAQSEVDATEVRIREVSRIERWHEVDLTLPPVAPQFLEVVVPTVDGDRTLVLARHSNRAQDFRLLVQVADGSLIDVPPPPVSTYRGFVAEDPDLQVAATLLPAGLKACVRQADGSAWYVEPKIVSSARLQRKRHLVYSQGDLSLGAGFCGTADLGIVPTPMTSNASRGGSCFRTAEIAFDADYENFLLNGSDVVATTLNIEATLNAVNDMYAREVAISHTLTQVIVRSAEPDPYPSFDPGTLLNSFRSHWNAHQGGVVRDMAHLATGKEMDGNIIGLAWVGVVCNQAWAYGLTQYNLGYGGIVSVLAHELGHNWNAPHCLDPSCVIMCGGCMSFGPITTQVVLDYRDNVGCLNTTGGYATAVPPKVRDESIEIEGAVVIDVLANDFDGNCDTVVIQSFDALSASGAAVELSSGTGPGGRDELRYTPAAAFEGLDSFAYEVGDGTGLSSPGLVSVELYDDYAELALHYRMDELSGTTFLDASGHGLDGNHVGPLNLGLPGAAPGTGTSIGFNGAFSFGMAPGEAPLNGLDGELSLAVWVHPNTVNGERWIFGNPSSWHLRIQDGDLIFRTTAQDYLVSPSLSVGSWSHVAVVFDASQDVTFYVDGVSLGTVAGAQVAGAPEGTWLLAGRSTPVALFVGQLDDLQVYDNTLDAQQILWLFQHPGEIIVECVPITNECSGSPNSVGAGATLVSWGSPSLTKNNLTLTAVGCPPHKNGLFYYGSTGISVPFGNGVRCVGGSITRMAPLQTDSLGFGSLLLDLQAPPFVAGKGQAVPGEQKRFQFWYRDPAAGGAGFNLTDALVVEFCL